MKLNAVPTALNEAGDDRAMLMQQLRQAGLLDSPELDEVRSKQEVGAGSLPQPLDMLAPMLRSVPQADR